MGASGFDGTHVVATEAAAGAAAATAIVLGSGRANCGGQLILGAAVAAGTRCSTTGVPSVQGGTFVKKMLGDSAFISEISSVVADRGCPTAIEGAVAESNSTRATGSGNKDDVTGGDGRGGGGACNNCARRLTSEKPVRCPANGAAIRCNTRVARMSLTVAGFKVVTSICIASAADRLPRLGVAAAG